MKTQLRFIRKPSGKVNLQVYIDRENRPLIDTGLRLKADQWNAKSQTPELDTREGKAALKVMQDLQRKVEDAEFNLIMQGKSLTAYHLKSLTKTVSVTSGFLEYYQDRMKSDTRLSAQTLSGHSQTLKKLKQYGDKPLNKIDFDYVDGFDNFLHAEGLHQNTIEKHHRNLRKYILLAVKNELIKVSPYTRFKLKRVPTNKQALTQDEVNSIEAIDYASRPALERVQRLFLFSCYTGLRYAEARHLTDEQLNKTRNGYEIVLHELRKYPTPVYLPLYALFDGKPNRYIIEWFHAPEGLKMPAMNNVKVNLLLKVIARDAGITKPLTFHIARHTFGTLLGAATGDAYLVMSLMGHADIKTSLIYVKSTPEIIKKKLGAVLWS